MIESMGQEEVERLDEANVPVDIWLQDVKENDPKYSEGFRFCLTASNYMPRTNDIAVATLLLYSDTKEELQEIVKSKMIPLYQKAMDKLNRMANGEITYLYYWE